MNDTNLCQPATAQNSLTDMVRQKSKMLKLNITMSKHSAQSSYAAVISDISSWTGHACYRLARDCTNIY